MLDFAGDDGAHQRCAGAVVDFDVGRGADQARVAVEDDETCCLLCHPPILLRSRHSKSPGYEERGGLTSSGYRHSRCGR